MVEEENPALSIVRQCELLGISRSGYYYCPVEVRDDDLVCMRVMDEIYTKRPFFGARRLRDELQDHGFQIGREHTAALMRQMGIEAIYPKKRLSQPNKENRIYPYLLRGLSIDHSDQVWCSDITYVRLRHGYAYLVAVMDWFSRYVLSWELSMSLESGFCVTALENALGISTPEIFNTDQGSQFTSEKFTSTLLDQGVKISMDGKGRALDNAHIERVWRSLKYEDIYLNDYQSIAELRKGVNKYFI